MPTLSHCPRRHPYIWLPAEGTTLRILIYAVPSRRRLRTVASGDKPPMRTDCASQARLSGQGRKPAVLGWQGPLRFRGGKFNLSSVVSLYLSPPRLDTSLEGHFWHIFMTPHLARTSPPAKIALKFRAMANHFGHVAGIVPRKRTTRSFAGLAGLAMRGLQKLPRSRKSACRLGSFPSTKQLKKSLPRAVFSA